MDMAVIMQSDIGMHEHVLKFLHSEVVTIAISVILMIGLSKISSSEKSKEQTSVKQDDLVSPHIMYWKLPYYWVMVGKWRRWFIPGALFFVAMLWLTPLIIYKLKSFPIAQAYIKVIYFSLFEPLRFVLKHEYPFRKLVWVIAINSWFALLGAAVGTVVGFFWKLIPRKPKSKKNDDRIIEMIEL